MKGLILKDILNLRNYAKQLLIMLGLFIVYGFVLNQPEFINFMLLMYGSMAVITTMGYDEKAGWDKIAFSLPVERRDIVRAKYLVWILLSSIAVVIASFFGILMKYMERESIKEYLLVLITVEAIYLMVFSIIIPIMYQMGTEKARLVMLGIFMIPTIAFILFAKFNKGKVILRNMDHFVPYVIPIIVIVSIMVIYASYRISISILKKKELE